VDDQDTIVREIARTDMDLSADARLTAGILLVTIVAVESGGAYMLRLVRGAVAVTPFQLAFARAGHAHAGVLVILGLVVQPFADAAGMTGAAGWAARSAIPVAAILMSAGFFLSSMGAGRTSPNRLILLVYAGAISLALGALSLGIGLLAA
jgi:hypothetical protein